MQKYNFSIYKKNLQKKLDADRFEHTLGVSYTAAALAMRYGEDVEKAQLAGLLHDNAKCLTDEKKIQICNKYNIHMTLVEQHNPFLLHAKVGAFLAMHKYKINDKEIIKAILYHTTGRPNMTMLEKIIYIADYIEPLRHKAVNLDQVRQMAFIDIDQALLTILSDTWNYLQETDGEIDTITQKTFEYYKKKAERQEEEIKICEVEPEGKDEDGTI